MEIQGHEDQIIKAKPKNRNEDSEDDSEIIEESPCGRWAKRREEVQQKNVPGIDAAYLAMDTEEGVEVVWNEVQFSERKNFKAQEDKIRHVFDNLIQLNHPNIVNFHKYWIDGREDKPRVVFITEYVSSGSLKQFLKRTKRNVKKPPLQSWKRWCTQILSALSYLHSCCPPIVHGNLTCDNIYIQHNGLVKIGSVAPDAIHHHVKTCRDKMKNTHFIAPEFATLLSPAVDVYSFGMCALEMAALEIHGNGDCGTIVTEDHVQRTIDSLESGPQRVLIRACLEKDPTKRPSTRQLLLHPTLFEVPSLKLLTAHLVVRLTANISETISDEVINRHFGPGTVVAEIRPKNRPEISYRVSDIPVPEKLEKFVEDVKFGIYPLTVFALELPGTSVTRALSPQEDVATSSDMDESFCAEKRRVVNMFCVVKRREEAQGLQMTLLLRLEDHMNRQLSCHFSDETGAQLAQELVHYGFVNALDKEKIVSLIESATRDCICRNTTYTGPAFQSKKVHSDIAMEDFHKKNAENRKI